MYQYTLRFKIMLTLLFSQTSCVIHVAQKMTISFMSRLTQEGIFDQLCKTFGTLLRFYWIFTKSKSWVVPVLVMALIFTLEACGLNLRGLFKSN
jgi:hypothetical protein